MVDWVKSSTFACIKSRTMAEDIIIEDELFADEPEQVGIVAEAPSRDIAEQLADLHTLKGAGFISMLKEITRQRASVDNRLKESIGQSNRILLNMAVDYNPRHLAMSIKRYFEQNQSALEVLIFKGSKIISIIREDTESYVFIRNFMMKY